MQMDVPTNWLLLKRAVDLLNNPNFQLKNRNKQMQFTLTRAEVEVAILNHVNLLINPDMNFKMTDWDFSNTRTAEGAMVTINLAQDVPTDPQEAMLELIEAPAAKPVEEPHNEAVASVADTPAPEVVDTPAAPETAVVETTSVVETVQQPAEVAEVVAQPETVVNPTVGDIRELVATVDSVVEEEEEGELTWEQQAMAKPAPAAPATSAPAQPAPVAAADIDFNTPAPVVTPVIQERPTIS